MLALEWIGFVVAIFAGVLGVRENLWHWPISLALHLIYAAIFGSSRLYAEMGRELIYFGLAVYGWNRWLRGGPTDNVLPISRLQKSGWIALVALLAMGTVSMGFLLSAAGGSSPWLDSFIALLSLAARFLFCGKRLECWVLWIFMDMLTIPLLFSRGLQVTGGLYVIYFGMAIWGLIRWSRRFAEQQTGLPPLATSGPVNL